MEVLASDSRSCLTGRVGTMSQPLLGEGPAGPSLEITLNSQGMFSIGEGDSSLCAPWFVFRRMWISAGIVMCQPNAEIFRKSSAEVFTAFTAQNVDIVEHRVACQAKFGAEHHHAARLRCLADSTTATRQSSFSASLRTKTGRGGGI